MASILAISASQSGPAHSFIIGEALQAAAAQAGHTLGLKVISHLGEQGWFSDSDLASADVALVVADGPVDLSGLPESLRIVESTPQAVFDDAAAVIAQAVGSAGKAGAAGGAAAAVPATAAASAGAGGPPPAGMKVVAITSCPTGVAHTFMAAEALEEGAKEAGYTIKVETRGSVGAQNTLTPEEIAAADIVVIAADTQVDKSRFTGKRLYSTSTKAAIHDAVKVLKTAWAEATPWGEGKAAAASSGKEEAKASSGSGARSGPYKHLMTGVSFMLPFVVAGGLLIALAFAIGGLDVPTDPNLEGTFGWYLFQVGAKYAFALMVPILAGYISFSIADRPGLAPGMVGGMISSAIGAGFLGGILAGFLAGYLTQFLAKTIKLPRTLESLKPVLILPLLCTGIIGVLMLSVLGKPMVAAMEGLTHWLQGMQGTDIALLGAILGAMMAFDLGGPVNKAAYVFGTTLLASNIKIPMAAVMAAGMVPPLGIAVACWIFRNRFSNEERDASKAAAVLGLAFITEGAIPFVARDPLRVIPSCMIGAAITGALVGMWHIELAAPHGGVFVMLIPGAISNVLLYSAAIAVGSVVTAVCLGVLKKPMSAQAQAATA
ncbi:PTS fructose transporter subunit EIIBC [Lautropia dentalis]|uniref:protein-N(pi)-phosphohistidine--D-fructose phosphotransferase n=1 Tax=Lautropia dentalis TaxID=2490857 RepID=A0A426FLZ8_9BURK|nr:fructose-specific PTS transporter subunit EIIC [Lautropia dentalis]RRN43836.1 PTS fructose transporter subunit EIIBC [Lautropia dentalis]